MHIQVYLKSRVGSCIAKVEVNRSVVAATLLAKKSGSRRTVLPFLLSLVDGGDCAAHGLEISVGLEIR